MARILCSADLETTTDIDDCRVYAVGCVEFYDETTFWHTKNLDAFMFSMSRLDSMVYFHNLKFDGEFLLYWLYRNGFRRVEGNRDNDIFTFTTLIDGMGNFYGMEIWFDYKNGYTPYSMIIRDSLKVIPLRVEQMPKAFGMENIEKLGDDYDYHKYREVGYTLTDSELRYLENDVIIVSKALEFLYDNGMTKMTTASNALTDYKSGFTKSQWKHQFPCIKDIDVDIRTSYKGGFTYLNDIYSGVELENVSVLDVNSIYPSVMRYDMLPYGTPLKYDGLYQEDKQYPLYIQKLACSFTLKDGKLPTIQLKGVSRFTPTEYIRGTKGDIIELNLTSVDLELFLEHYEISDEVYLGGYKFKATDKLFVKYIDKWTDVKIQAGKEGNDGMYTLSKLMLNSLYGKFGTNPNIISKIPVYNPDTDEVTYTPSDVEERDTMYLPIASFVTSYARRITIGTSQKIRDYSMEKYGDDRYIYSDTDSVHTTLTRDELEEILEIDPNELGYWDYEDCWKHAKYIRAKTYIQTNDKSNRWDKDEKDKDKVLNITCAGMSEGCYEYVTFDNFKIGAVYKGKTQGKRTRGGRVIIDTEFTIQ